MQMKLRIQKSQLTGHWFVLTVAKEVLAGYPTFNSARLAVWAYFVTGELIGGI